MQAWPRHAYVCACARVYVFVLRVCVCVCPQVGDKVLHQDVTVDGEPLDPPFPLTLILHKPVGYVVSACISTAYTQQHNERMRRPRHA